MRIHFAAAELAPLVQSGGLGDAVSGLARALAARGHAITCILPAYRSVLDSADCPELQEAGTVQISLPDRVLGGRWLEGSLGPNLRLRLLDLPELYDRAGLYGEYGFDYPDNPLRYIAFARAAAYLCDAEAPDALLAHDWHAGLTIATLRTALPAGAGRSVATVQVVHNNAYQGRCPGELFALTGLPPDLFHPDGVEAWGSLCLLKAGLMFADRIVAVSPEYAREIQHPPGGEGLEGVYTFLAHRLSGITNGIDTERFDPATDAALPANFSFDKPRGRARCRNALIEELELAPVPPGRLCVAIGRFAFQKGWDVLAAAVDGLVADGASLALLGSGDPSIAGRIAEAAARHPGRVGLRTGFDDALARRLYAGADAVLITSRFEPCGLVQLIAQRYGAVPVAHHVGGLVDTIVEPRRGPKGVDWSQATGILFSPLSPEALTIAAHGVGDLARKRGLAPLRRRLLSLDVSWRLPAMRWEKLLQAAVREQRGLP